MIRAIAMLALELTAMLTAPPFAAAAGDTPRLRYLGPGRETGTARVHLEDERIVELRAGESSVLGTVVAIDADELIVERPISDAEREHYRAAGGVVPDVARIHVRRDPPGAPSETSLSPVD